MGLMQAWMVVIIIGREFMVMGLREIASVEGLVIPASPLGKTKMILQVHGRLRRDSDRRIIRR